MGMGIKMKKLFVEFTQISMVGNLNKGVFKYQQVHEHITTCNRVFSTETYLLARTCSSMPNLFDI